MALTKKKNVMLVKWKEVDESEGKDLRSIPNEWKDASLSRIITARRLLRRVRHRTKLDLIIISSSKMACRSNGDLSCKPLDSMIGRSLRAWKDYWWL